MNVWLVSPEKLGWIWLARLNEADDVTPVAEAVTAYLPAVALAVAVMLAWPFASVTAELALSVALAPDASAPKLIVTPGSGSLSKFSVNSATSGELKAWLTIVVWPLPETATTV